MLIAKSDYSEYRIGEDWYKGQWRIAPEVTHDTLKVTCYNPKEAFVFKTDSDSITFDLKPNKAKDFYVQMGKETYAHTVIEGVPFNSNQLNFGNSQNVDFEFKYQTGESAYLEDLKRTFPLEFVDGNMDDTDIVLAVLNWTHTRWKHNGNNSPSKNDAITILNEAKEGQRFPCFAYAIVLR
ncbi:MAG: transglutaminase domain-containing protein, partial [Bacteroidota bacterium]